MNEDERKQMEEAGFTWDPTGSGHARWTHKTLGVNALRESWMRDQDWLKRWTKKIAEARNLRLFSDLPLGARFMIRHETKKTVYVKLDEHRVIQWNGPVKKKDPPDVRAIVGKELSLTERQSVWRVVELFEPFAELTPYELENLPKCPGMWLAIADYHDMQAAQAEAEGWIEPMKYSDERAKLFREHAKEISTRQQNS